MTGALETFIKERPLPDNPKKKGKVTVDDASAAVVRFANGALGTIEASRFATGRKNYNRFEINGSKGSIAFNLERLNELDVYLAGDDPAVQGFHNVMVTDGQHHPYVGHWWPPGHIIGYEHTFVHTVYDLLEAVAKEQGADAELRGRRDEPESARRDGKGRCDEEVGEGVGKQVSDSDAEAAEDSCRADFSPPEVWQPGRS